MKSFESEQKNDLDKEMQKELFLSAQSGCQWAKEQLILLNQGLVVFLAKKVNLYDEWEDLIQEGNLGLIKAIERYDPYLGYAFSTYASWWIKQSIQNYLLRIRPLIPLGKGMNQLISQMEHVREKMMQDLKREVSDAELAEEMGISVSKIIEIQKAVSECEAMFLDGNEKFGEYRISADDYSLHDEVIKKEMIGYLLDAVSYLNEREQRVLFLRYGINQSKEFTLQEIADQMNLCKERIRQIENQALRKLKLFFEKELHYNVD